MEKIKSLLNKIENDKINREEYLILLENEISNLINKIKNCQSILKSEVYFDLLEQAQFIVAKLIFKENISVSDFLWKFMKDFDRIDSPLLRNIIFNEIKNDQYSLK